MRDRSIDIRDPEFYREMATFVWVPKSGSRREGKYMAVGANTDDRLMALAIGVFLCPRNSIPLIVEHEESPKYTRAYAKYLELLKAGDFDEEEGDRLKL